MLLYVDTAISGPWIYRQGKTGPAIPDDLQPYMVRLAWVLEGPDYSIAKHARHLIRLPEGVAMDSKVAFATNLFDWLLIERGSQMLNVIKEFLDVLDEASEICAHDWQHHRHVLECSLRRINQAVPRWPKDNCAMIETTGLVQAPWGQPKRGGYKWPRFDECYKHFHPTPWRVTTNPLDDGINRVHAVRNFHHAALLAKDTQDVQHHRQGHPEGH